MDFGTMMKKIENGQYGKDIKIVYQDFLLVMDNCATYNQDNDEVLAEAARILALVPETFAKACTAIKKNTNRQMVALFRQKICEKLEGG